MTRKVNTGLLLFALCGIALWFAGNLYEAVVITPNLLTDPVLASLAHPPSAGGLPPSKGEFICRSKFP